MGILPFPGISPAKKHPQIQLGDPIPSEVSAEKVLVLHWLAGKEMGFGSLLLSFPLLGLTQ